MSKAVIQRKILIFVPVARRHKRRLVSISERRFFYTMRLTYDNKLTTHTTVHVINTRTINGERGVLRLRKY